MFFNSFNPMFSHSRLGETTIKERKMWYNKFMIWVLHSKLHKALSANTLTLTFKGRKSGKDYTVPVNYVRMGETLLTTSLRSRTWWRNLRGGAAVRVWLEGRELAGRATALEDEAGTAAALGEYFRKYPAHAKYFHVELDEQGRPRAEDLAELAKTRLVIKTRVTKE
jgi:deazaflavin-dependent oxidoreductase (nitroreductase family)